MQVLDPVASLDRNTLIFRRRQRRFAEICPRFGQRLQTGGFTFSERSRLRLAQIAGMTLASLLPAGCTPPLIDVPNDRDLSARVTHRDPYGAALRLAHQLRQVGHSARVDQSAMGQATVRLDELPLRIRFVPDRAALIAHLNDKNEPKN
jgi:hypothetical protein